MKQLPETEVLDLKLQGELSYRLNDHIEVKAWQWCVTP